LRAAGVALRADGFAVVFVAILFLKKSAHGRSPWR
jgi:hypothetical protein